MTGTLPHSPENRPAPGFKILQPLPECNIIPVLLPDKNIICACAISCSPTFVVYLFVPVYKQYLAAFFLYCYNEYNRY